MNEETINNIDQKNEKLSEMEIIRSSNMNKFPIEVVHEKFDIKGRYKWTSREVFPFFIKCEIYADSLDYDTSCCIIVTNETTGDFYTYMWSLRRMYSTRDVHNYPILQSVLKRWNIYRICVSYLPLDIKYEHGMGIHTSPHIILQPSSREFEQLF